MPAINAPRWAVQYGWTAGEDFWGGPMNQNLLFIDALTFPYILSMNFASPPQNVSNGDQYIVAAGAAGAWANQDGNMAYRAGDTWYFFKPTRGVRARLASLASFIWFNGTTWLDEATGADPGTPDPGVTPIFYDIGGTVPYAIEAAELILYLPLVQALSLPKNASGSAFRMAAAAPGFTQFKLRRNSTQVGTISIASGASTGTFEVGSVVSFGGGDILSIVAPDTVVAGFKNFGFTLRLNVLGS